MSDDGSPLEFTPVDVPEGFVAPNPENAPSDPPAPPAEKVESGAGVTSLLDRARTRGGARQTPKVEKNERPGRKTKTDRPAPPIPRGGFAPAIEKMYMTIGGTVFMLNPEVGSTIIKIAPDAAAALDELAKTNIPFRRFLVAMTQTTTLGAVIMAHGPLIAVIVKQAMSGNTEPNNVFQMFAASMTDETGGETPTS